MRILWWTLGHRVCDCLKLEHQKSTCRLLAPGKITSAVGATVEKYDCSICICVVSNQELRCCSFSEPMLVRFGYQNVRRFRFRELMPDKTFGQSSSFFMVDLERH
jgi:hypothetical protein